MILNCITNNSNKIIFFKSNISGCTGIISDQIFSCRGE